MFLRFLAWSCRPSAGLSKLRVFRTVDDGSRFESLGSQEVSEVAALLNCESTSYAYSFEFGVPCDGSQGPLQLDSSHRLHLL